MNILKIMAVIKEKNTISYRYEIEGEWAKYFNREVLFRAEYENSIEHVPDSVAVLPLIGNVILMASIFHAQIQVEEIDSDFYYCVEAFLEGFHKLSPQIDFQMDGLITADKIVINHCALGENRSMLFFSGGVDAWSSLISHREEKPLLVSIWGADIPYDNDEAWSRAKTMNTKIMTSYGLDFKSIHSTLRTFINEKKLDEYAMTQVGDNWWSAFQHSVGMMCLAAPYTEGIISKLYFASTYSLKDEKYNYVIASDPLIDNQVTFAGCHVHHDGYQYTRHEKIARICKYSKSTGQEITLRVCFKSMEGDNCCRCEKCCNTIFSILIEGYNPREFGFSYDSDKLPAYLCSGMQELAREEKYSFLSIYSHIQSAYRKKSNKFDVPKELKLFYMSDIHHLANFLGVPCNRCEEKDMRLAYLDEVMEGKNWLEKEYQLLNGKLREVEADWSVKNEWIAKLNKDISWLNDKIAELISENELLRRQLREASYHTTKSRLKGFLTRFHPSSQEGGKL